MKDSDTSAAVHAPFAAALSGDFVATKPPLGIIPRQLSVEKRLDEIVEAIGRYHRNHYIIPVEWFEEAAEIKRWLERQPTKLPAATTAK